MTQHFATPDAVLAKKALGSPWPAVVQRALASRAAVRHGVLTWFRDAPSGACFGGGASEGAALVTAASEAALGEDHDPGIERSTPVVDAGGEPTDRPGLVPAAGSFLPDLAALVASHGGRLAVVLPPTSTRRGAGFHVDPGLERDTLQLANQLGVAWVGLRNWTDQDGDFRDGLHLSVEAAPRFTAEMAARLIAANAMGPGAPVPATVPPPNPVRSRNSATPDVVAGEPASIQRPCTVSVSVPEFAAFGDDLLRPIAGGLQSPLTVVEAGAPLARGAVREGQCSGRFTQRAGTVLISTTRPDAPVRVGVDATSSWVWPGSGLVWTYPASGPVPGATTVDAEVVVVGAASPPPVLRIGAREVAFVGDGARRRLRVELGNGERPDLAIVAPAGGGWVGVRSLVVSGEDGPSVLVKPPAARRTDFLATPSFDPNPPPRLRTGSLAGAARARRLPAPWTDSSGCSPVQVLEDGVLLPTRVPNGAWIPVVTADGSDPAGNGRTYTLALADDRRCTSDARRYTATRAWLYPGDHLTATVALPRSSPPIGAMRVQVATPPSPAVGSIHLRVHAGDTLAFDEELPLATLRAETALPLPTAIAGSTTRRLVVEASLSRDAAPALLSWFGVEE